MQFERHSESFETDPIPTLRRLWSDPAFRAEQESERAQKQAELNARIDASMRRAWERQHGITS